MNNELYHHGILGQKWGVRRYQNRDGSLTEEGRRRYYNKDGSLTDEGKAYFKNGPSKKQKKGFDDTIQKAINKNMRYQDSKGYYEEAAELMYYQEMLDPDSKKYKEYDRKIDELSAAFDASLYKFIVDDLLDKYSDQEIRWLKENSNGKYAQVLNLDKFDKEVMRRQKQ